MGLIPLHQFLLRRTEIFKVLKFTTEKGMEKERRGGWRGKREKKIRGKERE